MFNIFKEINETNSSMTVQCSAVDVCEMRHTTLCKDCKHNRGMKKDKNCFERK